MEEKPKNVLSYAPAEPSPWPKRWMWTSLGCAGVGLLAVVGALILAGSLQTFDPLVPEWLCALAILALVLLFLVSVVTGIVTGLVGEAGAGELRGSGFAAAALNLVLLAVAAIFMLGRLL